MRTRLLLGFLAVLVTAIFASCTTIPESQLAYNACTPAHNSTFLSLSGHKAIVSGVSGESSRCFWSWDAPSTDAAIASAMSRCRKAMQRCFVYSTDQGSSDWVDNISNNGGTDPSYAAARASDQAAMNAMLGGLSAGLSAANKSNYSERRQTYRPPPRRSGGGGRSNCPGATIAVDESCHPLH